MDPIRSEITGTRGAKPVKPVLHYPDLAKVILCFPHGHFCEMTYQLLAEYNTSLKIFPIPIPPTMI